jgi:hypothetical protein
MTRRLNIYVYKHNDIMILYYVVSRRIIGMFIIKICYSRHRHRPTTYFLFLFFHYLCTVELI